jgi:hypothetical protein
MPFWWQILCLDVLAGLICGPILILWTLLSGELNMAINFESLHVLGFQVCTGLLVLVYFYWCLKAHIDIQLIGEES